MIPYWLMFLVPAFAAISERRRFAYNFGYRNRHFSKAWALMVLMGTLIAGFRFYVGGDYRNYSRLFELLAGKSFREVIESGDPGYQLVSWLALEWGGGTFTINLICGAIFSLGLVVFCRNLPRPWLALTTAIPYTFIVVGMGYTRQATALGLAMIGLVRLAKDQKVAFGLMVLLGATFHKSAVLLIPIAGLAASKNRVLSLAFVGLATVLGYVTLLADEADALVQNYVVAQYESQGALIRVLMNAVPATVLLLCRKRFAFLAAEGKLWFWFAALSLACVVLLFAGVASTAVDRMALYLIPLQLVVFSWLPEVFGKRRGANAEWVLAVVLYYALVEFVWLNFASHASFWVPYRSVLFL